MKMKSYVHRLTFALALFLLASAGHLAAQSKGRIEFAASVSPTGGRPEPVRQMTFYLLSKSLGDVRTEALQLEPAPDLDKFVDGLSVSPELKTWMKKRRSLDLAGSDFTKGLTADEVMDVPEFFKAYMSRNAGFQGTGFPKPKFKEKDREANPEKYKLEKDEYSAAIRKFIGAVPESVKGIDVDLTEINPSAKWERILIGHRQRLVDRTVELAQQRYLMGRADTDLEGRGSFTGIAPGTYWITMMGLEAISGDVRLRWDLPVSVRPGDTARVELTNLNAVRAGDSAQNSNH